MIRPDDSDISSSKAEVPEDDASICMDLDHQENTGTNGLIHKMSFYF